MSLLNDKNKIPFFIAIIVAVLATGYYVFSGKSSLDLNTRELLKDGSVAAVNVLSSEEIEIECKSGEKYVISFKEGQGNYEDLLYNACKT
ncbi:hypothetical protein ACFL2V_03290 [Pseudomonadota bacterium]